DPSLDENDVRRLMSTTSRGAVAYDQFPQDSLVRMLYEWDDLMAFVADALGYPRPYRYADTLGPLNPAVMREGDHLRWHFDQTDFVVSLLLQDCEAGGAYEVVPQTRSSDRENYEKVRNIISGSDRQHVITLDIQPGCL